MNPPNIAMSTLPAQRAFLPAVTGGRRRAAPRRPRGAFPDAKGVTPSLPVSLTPRTPFASV
jgi:hypothetical protein